MRDIISRYNGASAGNLYMNNSFSSILSILYNFTPCTAVYLYNYTTRNIQYYSLLRTNQNLVNKRITYLFKIYVSTRMNIFLYGDKYDLIFYFLRIDC